MNWLCRPWLRLLYVTALITSVANAELLTGSEPKALPADREIIDAFAKSSNGYSSDELLIRDDLRDSFLQSLGIADGTLDQERAVLLRLLQLRKSGKLTVKSSRRGPKPNPELQMAAEIAARVVADRHQVSTDSILADPNLRAELLRESDKVSSTSDPYSIRKLVLQLRKKRALKPELVLRVADWSRKIETLTSEELKSISASQIPARPGVYLFRDATGYLYIGEAKDLRERLMQHLGDSDRPTLAKYLSDGGIDRVSVELHIFPKNSPASRVSVRRAYESELIRSRNPKFNTRP